MPFSVLCAWNSWETSGGCWSGSGCPLASLIAGLAVTFVVARRRILRHVGSEPGRSSLLLTAAARVGGYDGLRTAGGRPRPRVLMLLSSGLYFHSWRAGARSSFPGPPSHGSGCRRSPRAAERKTPRRGAIPQRSRKAGRDRDPADVSRAVGGSHQDPPDHPRKLRERKRCPGSSFGRILSVTTFGESHGPGDRGLWMGLPRGSPSPTRTSRKS